ncbi:hypothetical protein D3C73_1388300 [compost metagenome]
MIFLKQTGYGGLNLLITHGRIIHAFRFGYTQAISVPPDRIDPDMPPAMELFAEAVNMVVDRPLYRVFQHPHPVQQLLARKRFAPVLI